jgi:multidrug efflux pump subunit AcrB
VRQDGRRGALISILKTGRASTLDIVDKVKKELPRISPRSLRNWTFATFWINPFSFVPPSTPF